MSNRHDSQFNGAIIDAIPFPLFVVDEDVKIVAFNHAGSSMLGNKPALALNTKGGEALPLPPLQGGPWWLRSIGGMQDLRRPRLGGYVLPRRGRDPPSTKDAVSGSSRSARCLPAHNDQPFRERRSDPRRLDVSGHRRPCRYAGNCAGLYALS